MLPDYYEDDMIMMMSIYNYGDDDDGDDPTVAITLPKKGKLTLVCGTTGYLHQGV